MSWFKLTFITLQIIILLIVAKRTNADSLEYVGTSVTYHINGDHEVSEKFHNKLGFNGNLIYTPIHGLIYTKQEDFTYTAYKGFFGNNSVGETMIGGIYSMGIQLYNTQIGVLAGAYYQDKSEFDKRNIRLGISSDFMPVFGLELNQKFYISDKEFIKWTNTLTPFITNHALSIGIDY